MRAPKQDWTRQDFELLLTDYRGSVFRHLLAETIERVNEQKAQLQALEKMKDDLTAMIVHDLRTPLTVIIGALESAEPPQGDEVTAEFMQMALLSGKRLLGMVNDLLDITKMESGEMKLELEEVEVRELAQGALEQAGYLAREKGLELTADLPEGLPRVRLDGDKFSRVLVNLLSNAIKFTPTGGQVRLSARVVEGGKEMEFAVADTGEGIPPDWLERVFEKFGQVESRKSGRRMSTGLGLTFCKMVVEAHGGRIWVESDLGKGSTFRLRVPVQPPG
jgi:signal transduction histidine kinase